MADPIDCVVHRLAGWPDDACRLAAEYPPGLQLDLVFMPAALRHGIPDRSIAVVDKDDRLLTVVTPEARDFPPFELPPGLAATYAGPTDVAAIATANRALATLLDGASTAATAMLGGDVSSPLASTVRNRLT